MGISNEQMVIPNELFMKRARIIASTQNDREHLYEALDYATKGLIKVVTETYPLNEIDKAHERLANGQVRFRAVITM